MRRVEVFRPKLVVERFEPGLDVAHEFEVGRLALGVVGLAGHRDVAFGSELSDRGIQFSNRAEPLLQLVGRVDRFVEQAEIPGFDVLPGCQLGIRRKPAPRKRFRDVSSRTHG